MKKLLIIFYTLLFISITACENSITKKYGGTTTITLESNQIFKNITWKEDNLWVLYEDTVTNNYIFNEYSTYGIFQGKVVIKQNKKVNIDKTFKYEK